MSQRNIWIQPLIVLSLLQQNTCLWKKYLSKYIKTVKKLGLEQIIYHTRSIELTKECSRKNRHSPPHTTVPITLVVLVTPPSPWITYSNGHLGPL